MKSNMQAKRPGGNPVQPAADAAKAMPKGKTVAKSKGMTKRMNKRKG